MGLARNTGVAESGAAPEDGLSTDCDEEVNKLAKKKALLRSSHTEIGTYEGFENNSGETRVG